MAAYILVCDDEKTVRVLVSAMLRHAGYEVATAADARDALGSARERVPDLIVTDLLMPGMDGYGLADALRADARLAHVPIVLLTAAVQRSADLAAAREHGIAQVIRKPFARAVLLATVADGIGRGSAAP